MLQRFYSVTSLPPGSIDLFTNLRRKQTFFLLEEKPEHSSPGCQADSTAPHPRAVSQKRTEEPPKWAKSAEEAAGDAAGAGLGVPRAGVAVQGHGGQTGMGLTAGDKWG